MKQVASKEPMDGDLANSENTCDGTHKNAFLLEIDFSSNSLQTGTSLVFKPPVILPQFLITDFLNLRLFRFAELLPDGLIHLDNAQSFWVVQHLHIFKAFERVGENVPFCLFGGVAAFGEDAVLLFHGKTGGTPTLVVGAEVGNDVVQLHTALFVGVEQNRLD